jgi:hypothetical protein
MFFFNFVSNDIYLDANSRTNKGCQKLQYFFIFSTLEFASTIKQLADKVFKQIHELFLIETNESM